MTFQVLSGEGGSRTRLAVPPASVWIISTLEVVLAHRGRTTMLLTYPSYPLTGQPVADTHQEGYWAPPFMAYPVDVGFSPPATFGSTEELVEAALSKIDVLRDLQQLCYQMGLRDVRLRARSPFLELKTSPREPTVVKAYWILRHALIDLDESCLANLADSEVRRGYVHLPTDLDPELVSVRQSSHRGREERWFLGKPVQSNVEYVLGNADRRASVEQSAIAVDASAFARNETGVLCAVDLAGYGMALQYAGEAMHSPGVDGAAAQAAIRGTIANLLERMLAETGATQAQLAGDGFIASYPDRVHQDRSVTIRSILDAWNRVLGTASRINSEIRTVGNMVGSRLSLHAGPYRYGRVSGPASYMPSFDGQSIVNVARLEQALSNSDWAELGAHRLVASATVIDDIGDIESLGWIARGKRRLTAKEFSEQAWLYSRSETSDDDSPDP